MKAIATRHMLKALVCVCLITEFFTISSEARGETSAPAEHTGQEATLSPDAEASPAETHVAPSAQPESETEPSSDIRSDPRDDPEPEVSLESQPSADPQPSPSQEPDVEDASTPHNVPEPEQEPMEPASEAPDAAESEDEPAPRSSGPPHCHGQHLGAWTFEDIIAARTNNFGFANGIRASRCWPLFADRDRQGIMFALSNVEVGFVNWLAPVFLHLGGYVSITPISLLTFTVEATGYYWWPVSLTRSGHIPMSGYDDRFTSSGIIQNVPDERLHDALGVNVVMGTTVRGRVRVGDISSGTVHFIIANTLNFEYWRQGSDDYYWSLRADAIFAKSDWALTNRAVLLFSFPLNSNYSLRVGVYDQLLYSFGNFEERFLQRHEVGGLIGLNIGRLRNRILNFETTLVVTGLTHLVREMRGFPPLNFQLLIKIPLVWPRS